MSRSYNQAQGETRASKESEDGYGDRVASILSIEFSDAVTSLPTRISSIRTVIAVDVSGALDAFPFF